MPTTLNQLLSRLPRESVVRLQRDPSAGGWVARVVTTDGAAHESRGTHPRDPAAALQEAVEGVLSLIHTGFSEDRSTGYLQEETEEDG